jgi:hypothetical protein
MSRLWWLNLFVIAMLFPGWVRSQEYRNLFNGKDLDGWHVEGARDFKDRNGKRCPMWTVENGLITCYGKGFGFLRYTGQEFADFRLSLEYRLGRRGNSGLGIRTPPYDPRRDLQTRPSFAAYEIQLLDDPGKAASKNSSGSLYRYVAPRSNPVKPNGEWNSLTVECRGPRICLWINGVQIHDVDQATLEEIKAKPLKGYVCLQSHSNKAEFRNIRIQEIKTVSAR